MAGARAAEAVVATHVENALELAWLLRGVMPVNAAADHYLREFGLPAGVAQMVLQRVQARVAGDELTAPGGRAACRPGARGRPGLERAGGGSPSRRRTECKRVGAPASELEARRQIEVVPPSRSPSSGP